MTGPKIDHMDVGAYALGVLGDWEASQFEMHLAGCPTCAHELEELTLVSSLLSHVDGNSIAVVEEYGRDGRAFDRMINVVSMERRRARTRRVMSMAAGFVLVAGGVTYGLFGSSPFAGTGGTQGSPQVLPTPISTFAVKVASTTYQAKDQSTGAQATIVASALKWGTQLELTLRGVKGPLACRLVAVSKSGDETAVMSWTVPADGYGTMKQPDPLVLNGATALKDKDTQRYEVRTTDAQGSGSTLVTVPVTS